MMLPNRRSGAILGCAMSALAACASQQARPEESIAPKPELKNPLLAEWAGPFGGVPPFGTFKVHDIQPALEAGMADELREVDRIAKNPEAPSFENTIAALERTGKPLERASTVYGIYTSTMNDDAVKAIETAMSPRMAAFNDQIVQNSQLFARIATLYESRDRLGLSPEQQRLLWLDYTRFVRSGAKLDDAAKQRLSALNQQLASLYEKFRQNLLAEENSQMVILETEADLAGLPPGLREAAASAAASHGHAGKWVVVNTRSSVDPFLTLSSRRDLREKVWRMFVMRGDNGDARDNKATITEILKLRAERAKLLGYATHAHWRLENTMAKTPERAEELMEAVWKPAVARVHEEVADMQALADKEGAKIKIEPWDYRYYMEKVRKAKYDLDQNEVKPYLQLEKLREGIFWVAGELFNFNFTLLTNLPVAHPDIRV